ncbi:MAG: lysophospholipid acyltransferase family protein [Gammaproteobacteria bacterium]|nr:lysophospholipid acyltransferase family protein [Gammaproteobacteria bacterium]
MIKYIFNGILSFLSLFSLRINHAIGGSVGWLMFILPTQLRHIASINIAACLPQHSTLEQQRILKTSLIETGKALTEIGPLWKWRAQRIVPLVREVINEDAVQQAYKKGKGVIFVTPHLGCWEIAGLYAASRYPMTTLYRPPRQMAIDPFIHAGRERTGTRLVAIDAKGIRNLYQALAKGETIGVLPDQEPGEGSGVYAPFFGRPAYSMVLLSRLARKSKAAVFFAYCERLPKGQGYKLVFRTAPDEVYDKNIETSVQAVNQEVESCVLNLPEQYQWGYKRFRANPPGYDNLY